MARWRAVAGRGGSWVGLALVLSALLGCGGTKTYPVKGKVVFDRGDVNLLAGSTIDCRHEENPLIEAHGTINEDGTFELETYNKGKILRGACAGTYRAWIVLTTEGGSEDAIFRKVKVDPRFLDPRTSGLTLNVPASGEVTFTVTKAKPGAKLPRPPDPKGC
jgi:hypothetical protein